jgi:hypothetical protein
LSLSVTIIVVPTSDLESFESMDHEERRDNSGGWKTFAVGSGRFLDTFLMKATGSDFGVLECEDRTCLIDKETLLEALPVLEALVETKAKETTEALFAHGKKQGDVARIGRALKSGSWPKNGGAAEEAAAFAHQLLKHARIAKQKRMGVCWEYRGEGEP